MTRPDTTKQAPGHRDAYRQFTPVTTRWMDNDVFGHINNAVYYSLFDTAVTSLLVSTGLLDWRGGAQVMVVAESGCIYYRSVAFPEPLDVGLRIARLGTSAVRYELAVFATGGTAAAEGFFVHVCVDATTRQPVPLPDLWRSVLTEFV